MSRTGRIWISVVLGVVAATAAVSIIVLDLDLILLVVLAVVALAWLTFIAGSVYVVEIIERVVWPKGVTGLDDRGMEVELRDFKQMPNRFRPTRQERKRIDAAALKRPAPRGLFLLLSMWLVALVVHGGLWYFGFDLSGAASWAMFVFLWLPLMVWMCRTVRVGMLRWHNPALVVIGRCPSCGYDLTELPRQSDGCVVCPECGSAWVLENLVSGESINDSSGSLGQHGRPSPPPSP